jgi:hypothetical protein
MSRPLQKGGIMIRRFALLAAAAAAATLSFASVASAAPVTQATPAAQACPSGYFTISNNSPGGPFAIAGDGVNNPVYLAATGNCFEHLYPFPSPIGGTGYEYQNGYGHCLWWNGTVVGGGFVELGAACKPGHPNEEFYGISLGGGGWTVGNVGSGGGVMDPGYCGVASGVGFDSGSSCDRWNF